MAEEYEITTYQFEKWVEMYDEEEFVTKVREHVAKIDADLFENMRITSIDFVDDIPEELDAPKYLSMYKKIWATLRHDLYVSIKERCAEKRVNKLSEEDFRELYEKSHAGFEKIRKEVYA